MSNRNARRAWKAAVRKYMRRGHVYHLEIRHDDWCHIYSPAKVCTCNPHRVLMDEDRRVLVSVEGVGEYGPLELVGPP